MARYENLLRGGDLRSIGNSNTIALGIKDQNEFDKLIKCLFNKDRVVVMRAADAIEKITISRPSFLLKHKQKLLALATHVADKELKWHLALLIPRLALSGKEFLNAWDVLSMWAKDESNSRIVRVNSLQGLYELTRRQHERTGDLIMILLELKKENIPSLTARIKKIRKQIVQDH